MVGHRSTGGEKLLLLGKPLLTLSGSQSSWCPAERHAHSEECQDLVRALTTALAICGVHKEWQTDRHTHKYTHSDTIKIFEGDKGRQHWQSWTPSMSIIARGVWSWAGEELRHNEQATQTAERPWRRLHTFWWAIYSWLQTLWNNELDFEVEVGRRRKWFSVYIIVSSMLKADDTLAITLDNG